MKHLLRAVICFFAVFSFSLPVFATTPEAASASQTAQSGAAKTGNPVNINSADAQTIVNAHIKGIGKKRAEAIVAYRQQHGPFKSVDDLKNIKGISKSAIEENRNRLI